MMNFIVNDRMLDSDSSVALVESIRSLPFDRSSKYSPVIVKVFDDSHIRLDFNKYIFSSREDWKIRVQQAKLNYGDSKDYTGLNPSPLGDAPETLKRQHLSGYYGYNTPDFILMEVSKFSHALRDLANPHYFENSFNYLQDDSLFVFDSYRMSGVYELFLNHRLIDLVKRPLSRTIFDSLAD